MTYRELLKVLQEATQEQLDSDISIMLAEDEFMSFCDNSVDEVIGISGDGDAADGILDPGYLYLKAV